MTKKELLDYLYEVRDTEFAMEQCQNRLTHLRAQKSEFNEPSAPARYVREPSFSASGDSDDAYHSSVSYGCFIYFFVGIASFILGIQGGLMTGLMCAGVGLVLTIIVASRLGKAAVRRKHRRAHREAEKQAEKNYQLERSTYHERRAAYDRAVAPFDQQIRVEEARLRRLEAKLATLYARNILHAEFHSYSAVAALSSYIEMGACNTLEGPDGAYALYLRRH